MIGKSSPIKARKPAIHFIFQRLSKVPQSIEQKRALRREIPAIRRIWAGTIIAEIELEVRVLFFKVHLIEQVRVPFNVGGSDFNETAADRR